ncbi:MAG: alpha/beta fold hydrolase [Nannocystales bacterium]
MDDWYAHTNRLQHGSDSTVVRDEGDGPAVLCLHGFPTSSWDFEPLWADLTAHRRAIAFDLFGLGRASKPDRPLPVSQQADLAEAVLESCGVKQAHLFCHDLGDSVGQELLARQADGSSHIKWTSAVFLNGGLFPETHRPRPIQRLLISPLGRWVARLSSERTFRRSMERIFGPDTPPSDAFLRGSWALLVADGGRTALPHLIRYMEERKTHRERWVRPLLDNLVPTRVINGNADPVSGRHAAQRYADLVPDADVVHIPNIGHYPHVEDPAAVYSASNTFWAVHE